MHVGERVVDVEVFLEVESVGELIRVLVEHDSLDQGLCLHLATLVTSLKYRHIFEPCQSTAEATRPLNVLIDWHEFKSLIQVKVFKLRLGLPEVLRVTHTIVLLVLPSV